MASSMEKELAKQLECGICLQTFKEPKVLSCQHSYCKKCLERLVMTTVGRDEHEISCPECRMKTKVPDGDVKSLPSNFLINNLLSIRGNNQSNASQCCEKHDGEILKLFCRTCDQLICRDCIVIDHCDHKYTFVKEIFPAVKEEIVDVVQKSRANIRALESSIETIKRQDNNMQKNCMELNREIDNLIDQLIEHLERKRQSIKDDLRESATVQKENLDAQKESFQMSLGCLKSSVEFTEDALNRGSEVKILSAKNQMIQQLTELNSATSDLKPRGHIYYSLETDFKPRGRIYNPQENLDAQIESLQASSGSLRSSVGLTEEAATRRSEAEILSPKNQMIQQQSEHNSATSDFKPIAGRRIYNRLETCYPPINFAALGKIAEIREYDEEYPRLYPRLN